MVSDSFIQIPYTLAALKMFQTSEQFLNPLEYQIIFMGLPPSFIVTALLLNMAPSTLRFNMEMNALYPKNSTSLIGTVRVMIVIWLVGMNHFLLGLFVVEIKQILYTKWRLILINQSFYTRLSLHRLMLIQVTHILDVFGTIRIQSSKVKFCWLIKEAVLIPSLFVKISQSNKDRTISPFKMVIFANTATSRPIF